MKIFEVAFKGMWPVGNCLIIAAESMEEAEKMAADKIVHTDDFKVFEVNIDEPRVIVYLSGDY